MQLKHFVAYHSVSVIGYPYPAGDLHFYTSKHAVAQRTLGQLVWVIEGCRVQKRTEYGLCAVHLVTRVVQEEGQSVLCGPALAKWEVPLPLNALEWFPEFLRRSANFSLGVSEISSPETVAHFMECAAEVPWDALLLEVPIMVRMDNFTAADYGNALQSVDPTQKERDLLHIHCAAPAGVQTARQLAMAMGFADWRHTNLVYGKLASKLCKALGVAPATKLSVLVRFQHSYQEEVKLVLRETVIQAIHVFLQSTSAESFQQEEIPLEEPLYEGAVHVVQVNAFERNPRARAACIAHHGSACVVCGFRFGSAYGKVAEKYIQVHHLKPLADVGEQYRVDPVQDLRPVCANCHCVMHLRTPPYTVEEMQQWRSSAPSAPLS